MKNRTTPLAVAIAGLLVFGATFSTGATAQTPVTIPANPQITDPAGDSNFLNDQDNSNICKPTPCQLDNTTPADVGTVSDFLAAWFTHTETEISLHIQTERPPPASTTLYFRLAASPAPDATGGGCLNMRAVFPGANASTYVGEMFAQFEDTCNAPDVLVPGTVTIGNGPNVTAGNPPADGASGITTLTFPRSASPLLADGQVITGAYLIARLVVGSGEGACDILGPPTGPCWFSAAQGDNTARGADYTLTSSAKPTAPPGKCKPKKKPTQKPKKCKPVPASTNAASPPPSGPPPSPSPTSS